MFWKALMRAAIARCHRKVAQHDFDDSFPPPFVLLIQLDFFLLDL